MKKKLIILGLVLMISATSGLTQWSWKVPAIDNNVFYYDVHSFNPSSAIAVGNGGRIIKTSDGGNTWNSILSGSNEDLNKLFFVNSMSGWIVGNNGTILHSDDGGATWIFQTGDTTTESLHSVFFVDPYKGWAVGNNIVINTTDGGNTWSRQFSLPGARINSVFFTDTLNGWFAGNSKAFYHTSNGGSNWISINPYPKDYFDIFFYNSNYGWATSTDGFILSTQDGGNNWTLNNTGITDTLFSIFFNNELNGWAVGKSGTILRSIDGGANWLRQYSSTVNDLYSVHFTDLYNGWTTGSIGTVLQYRTDSTSLPVTSIIQTNDDSIVFSSHGATINFDPAFTTISSPADVTIGKYSEGFPIGTEPDTIATIFNTQYWGISCNLDSFKANVCFTIDTSSLNTDALDLINLVYQCNHGPFWSLVETTPFLSGNQICFSTEHFSNWALGITKPTARVRRDTTVENSGNEVLSLFKDFPQTGVGASFKVRPAEIDTITVKKYEVNPGGDLPAGINRFGGSYFNFKKIIPDTVFLNIDPSSIAGYSENDSGMYRILTRKNASSDWNILPTSRVRRGMKEVLVSKFYIKQKSDFTLGKSSSRLSGFYCNYIFDENKCAGDTVHFYSNITGGIPPYSYLWFAGDSLIGNENSLNFVFTSKGNYAINLKVRDSSGIETEYNQQVNINCITSISEPFSNVLKVYPNPVLSNHTELFLEGNLEKVTSIELFDMKGNRVYRNALNYSIPGNKRIAFKNLNPGLYLLRINGNGIHLKKQIVVN